MRKKNIHFDKQIYVDMAILDLSKLHIYDFHYNVMMNYDPSIKLCYMDTDSFIYVMSIDPYESLSLQISMYIYLNQDNNLKFYYRFIDSLNFLKGSLDNYFNIGS
jgi:hypothetical protein